MSNISGAGNQPKKIPPPSLSTPKPSTWGNMSAPTKLGKLPSLGIPRSIGQLSGTSTTKAQANLASQNTSPSPSLNKNTIKFLKDSFQKANLNQTLTTPRKFKKSKMGFFKRIGQKFKQWKAKRQNTKQKSTSTPQQLKPTSPKPASPSKSSTPPPVPSKSPPPSLSTPDPKQWKTPTKSNKLKPLVPTAPKPKPPVPKKPKAPLPPRPRSSIKMSSPPKAPQSSTPLKAPQSLSTPNLEKISHVKKSLLPKDLGLAVSQRLDDVIQEAKSMLNAQQKSLKNLKNPKEVNKAQTEINSLNELINSDKKLLTDIIQNDKKMKRSLMTQNPINIVNNRATLLSAKNKVINKKTILSNFKFSEKSKGNPIKQFTEIMLKFQENELKAYNNDKKNDIKKQKAKLAKTDNPAIQKMIQADMHRSNIQIINYTEKPSGLNSLSQAIQKNTKDSKAIEAFIKKLETGNLSDDEMTQLVFEMDKLSMVIDKIFKQNSSFVQDNLKKTIDNLTDENALQQVVDKHKNNKFPDTNTLKSNIYTAIAPFILSTESFELGLKTNTLTNKDTSSLIQKFSEFVNRRNPGPLGDAASLLK